MLLAVGCGGGSGGGAKTLVGAGSTLVAPLVAKWSFDYQRRAGVTVTYGAVGSGTGIAQIRSVDFAASDAPLTTGQASVCKGCVQIPWALAATLVAYHVKGVPNRLKLSGAVLAGIYLGVVRHWNDAAIRRLNPGVRLPATAITPVFRSDGSGDTYAFSDYLSKVSPVWKRTRGVSTAISFPTGAGARGNAGVSAYLGRNDGAIGYLGISYGSHFDHALVENAAGKFPEPGVPSIEAAAKSVTSVPADNAISITSPPASAAGAYPISTFTYAIVPKSSPKASALRAFLTYAVTTGQKFGPPLQFARLPAVVLEADRAAIAKIG
ncbi:MAG: phosphate ABC transporter substrate-binding protein PstS [Gaiellaceae bacterium]